MSRQEWVESQELPSLKVSHDYVVIKIQSFGFGQSIIDTFTIEAKQDRRGNYDLNQLKAYLSTGVIFAS